MNDEFYCPRSASGRSLRFNFSAPKVEQPKVPKQKPIKLPKMPKIHMPEMPEWPDIPQATPPTPPAPVEVKETPTPPPPPTATSAETAEASDQMRRDMQKRKGLRRTILAGDTGGYQGRLGGGTILGGAGAGANTTPSA